MLLLSAVTTDYIDDTDIKSYIGSIVISYLFHLSHPCSIFTPAGHGFTSAGRLPTLL
jgi:hypothetical protein